MYNEQRVKIKLPTIERDSLNVEMITEYPFEYFLYGYRYIKVIHWKQFWVILKMFSLLFGLL